MNAFLGIWGLVGSAQVTAEWATPCRKMERKRKALGGLPNMVVRAYVIRKEAGFPEPVSIRVRFLSIRLAQDAGERERFAAAAEPLLPE